MNRREMLMSFYLLHICSASACGSFDALDGLPADKEQYRSRSSELLGIEEQGQENAATNCHTWGYSAKGAVVKETCERLMRADYNETDSTYTFPGTVIGFLDMDDLKAMYGTRKLYEAPEHYPGYADLVLEGIWGPKRAYCIENPRWKSNSPFGMWTSVPIFPCDTVIGPYPSSPWRKDVFRDEAKMISYSDHNDVPIIQMQDRTGFPPLVLRHDESDSRRGPYDVLSTPGALFVKPPYRCSSRKNVTISGKQFKRCAVLSRGEESNYYPIYKWVREIKLPNGKLDYDTILTRDSSLNPSYSANWSKYQLYGEWSPATPGSRLGVSFKTKPSVGEYRWADDTVELFLLRNRNTGRHAVAPGIPTCPEVEMVQSLGFIMKYLPDKTGWALREVQAKFCGTGMGILP